MQKSLYKIYVHLLKIFSTLHLFFIGKRRLIFNTMQMKFAPVIICLIDIVHTLQVFVH